MCSLSCHRLPRQPLELGSLMTVHLLWGQLGGHQQQCSATPGSLKSLKLGLSELTPLHPSPRNGERCYSPPGALKMAPPFLERLRHKGFSPPPSEPSQAPTHDQSCSPPGSPGSFSELRTLVSFPTGTDELHGACDPRGTVDPGHMDLESGIETLT